MTKARTNPNIKARAALTYKFQQTEETRKALLAAVQHTMEDRTRAMAQIKNLAEVANHWRTKYNGADAAATELGEQLQDYIEANRQLIAENSRVEAELKELQDKLDLLDEMGTDDIDLLDSAHELAEANARLHSRLKWAKTIGYAALVAWLGEVLVGHYTPYHSVADFALSLL